MIKVAVFKECVCPYAANWVTDRINLAERVLKSNKKILEIIITNGRQIRKINKKYRGYDRVTDVLSFAWQEEKKVKSDLLGQIYICYPQIVKQARERHIATAEEFTRMLVHGFMHLLGYDHATKAQEKKMFALQERIVAALSFPRKRESATQRGRSPFSRG